MNSMYLHLTRRRFLSHTSAGLGMAAAASLLGESARGGAHFRKRKRDIGGKAGGRIIGISFPAWYDDDSAMLKGAIA